MAYRVSISYNVCNNTIYLWYCMKNMMILLLIVFMCSCSKPTKTKVRVPLKGTQRVFDTMFSGDSSFYYLATVNNNGVDVTIYISEEQYNTLKNKNNYGKYGKNS